MAEPRSTELIFKRLQYIYIINIAIFATLPVTHAVLPVTHAALPVTHAALPVTHAVLPVKLCMKQVACHTKLAALHTKHAHRMNQAVLRMKPVLRLYVHNCTKNTGSSISLQT